MTWPISWKDAVMQKSAQAYGPVVDGTDHTVGGTRPVQSAPPAPPVETKDDRSQQEGQVAAASTVRTGNEAAGATALSVARVTGEPIGQIIADQVARALAPLLERISSLEQKACRRSIAFGGSSEESATPGTGQLLRARSVDHASTPQRTKGLKTADQDDLMGR